MSTRQVAIFQDSKFLMIAIVILAAGKSSRLGRKKQLLKWKNTTLLEQSILAAQQTNYHPIIVITPPDDREIARTVQKYNVHNVANKHRHLGVSSSIKLGTEVIEKHFSQVSAAIFMVCDQPYISTNILQQLGDKYHQGGEIVTCRYGDTIGIPTLLSKKYFADILNLEGDFGAKRILRKYADKCHIIDFPLGKIDIDTLDDYKNLQP